MSKVLITPKNWNDGGKELLELEWSIRYRFYDETGKKKQCWISDFNRFDTLQERRKQLKGALEYTVDKLKSGYNPITGLYTTQPPGQISIHTPFIEALRYAYARLKHAGTTMRDIGLVIANVAKCAPDLPVSEVSRKHLKEVFEKCAMLKTGTFSPDKYNRHRTYLGILYDELMEYEVVQANIPLTLKKQKGAIRRVPVLLTDDQRKQVSKHLRDNYTAFWLYMQCFFHSGARSTEMMRLKVKDIDLQGQKIKYLVLKDAQYREAFRVIPDIAVKYWQAVIWNAPPDYYVFSRGKKPGPVAIRSYQVTKSWNRLVKKQLGIDVDFYKAKHLKMTLLSDELSPEHAALQGAESVEMINKKYDVNSKTRNESILRGAGGEF